MKLLVSVANSSEARRATNGGADLIDAKDPSTGALGALPLATLEQIHATVGGRRIVTAALGDASDEAGIEQLAYDYGSVGVGFVKVGFASVTDVGRVERLIAAAVRGARATGRACGVVAVAYADTGGTTSIDATALVDLAARAQAMGVLLDTAIKGGPGLRQLMTARRLETWVTSGHRAGLIVALAGKLTPDDLSFVLDAGADIAGVRGAACADGRATPVIAERVSALKSKLYECRSPRAFDRRPLHRFTSLKSARRRS